MHGIHIFGLYILFVSKCQNKLELVQVICRHGDRTPENMLPVDDNSSQSWPNGLGQLTPLGMNQALKIGLYLRKRYVNSLFINSTYVREEVKAYSTYTDRTMQTASVVMFGMFYPVEKHQKYHRNTNVYPVPIHTQNFDYGVDWNNTCPFYIRELIKQFYTDDDASNIMWDFLSQKAGFNLSLRNVYKLHDIIKIEKIHNRTRNWVNETVLSFLRTMAEVSMNKLYVTRELTDIRAGIAFRILMNNIESKIRNSLRQKFVFYAAHDVTIFGILRLLYYNIKSEPGYVSFIIIELHSNRNEYYLSFHYYNGTHTSKVNIPAHMRDISTTVCGKKLCSLKNIILVFNDTLNSVPDKRLCFNSFSFFHYSAFLLLLTFINYFLLI